MTDAHTKGSPRTFIANTRARLIAERDEIKRYLTSATVISGEPWRVALKDGTPINTRPNGGYGLSFNGLALCFRSSAEAQRLADAWNAEVHDLPVVVMTERDLRNARIATIDGLIAGLDEALDELPPG